MCPEDQICGKGTCVVSNDHNCGVYGNACKDGNTCVNKACVCASTGELCSLLCTSTGCVDPKYDPHNCGAAGVQCEPNQVCDQGQCASSCSNGLVRCDSSCFDVQNDPMNCGDCGVQCSTSGEHVAGGACKQGVCKLECEPGWVNADGRDANGCEEEVKAVCGNGLIENGEVCDGSRLNDETCESLVGLGSTGKLRCAADCLSYDMGNCSAPTTCGNGKVDEGEVCDNLDINGATCESVVGEGSTGVVLCNANCLGFSLVACSAPTTCGNAKLDDGEKCDGDLINGATCESVVGVGSKGTVRCDENCANYDIAECTAAAECGNNQLETGEVCDGTNFNGATCASLVGAGSRGSLVCNGCGSISTANCSAPSTCGNGTLEGNEVCDGSNINNATCESVVGEGSQGTLKCASNCANFDISQCSAASTCGNGFVENGEACDGERLNDQTCSSVLGVSASGSLACKSDCSGFDTSSCVPIVNSCGNGTIDTALGEVCDGNKLNNATCESLVGKGSTGNPLCASGCKSYDLSQCTAASKCGNGSIDAGEVCDGSNVGGMTSCELAVGSGSKGEVKCASDCKSFDLSSCSAAQDCGNATIDDGEVCDGTNLGGRVCADVVGYGSKGSLKCASNCKTFDTSLCTAEVTCGNGKLDAGEVCDGSLLNGASCASRVGYGSTGTLVCNSTCDGYDTSACSPEVTCGNGELDDGEVCDGTLIGSRTCVQQVGYGSVGTPGCNATCSGFTNGTCTAAVTCGNGTLDAGEVCEGNNFNGATCESLKGTGSTGNLKCTSNCTVIDTSACSASVGCGNGTLDSGEACDGSNFAKDGALLGSNKCADYAPSLYSAGSLSCSNSCEIDFSKCTKYCGNDVRNTTVGGVYIGEVCDTTKFPTDQNSCEKVVGKGSQGELKCADDCKSIITNGCTEAAYCGNNKLDDDEWCDGDNWLMGSDDCSVYGEYKSGSKVVCRNCEIDLSKCVAKETCGDGEIYGSEECDGDNFLLNETTCAGWSNQYVSGNVKCSSTCRIDYSDCQKTVADSCGDGKLGDNELCDGTLFYDGIKSCAEYAPKEYASDELKCNNCEIDESACVKISSCGNNTLDEGEVCDGTKFSGNKTSCKTLWPSLYSGGSVTCNDECGYDTSACVPWCGDGTVSYSTRGEQCDINLKDPTNPKFYSSLNTCAKVVGAGYEGTLSCKSDCTVDSTNCKNTVYCGNNKVDGNDEKCDGTAFLNNKTQCSDWNEAYASGTVSCNNDCTLNYANCVVKADDPYCGDHLLDENNEECDYDVYDPDFDTCAKYSSTYGGGSLKCKDDCTIDDSNCILKTTLNCGNGQLDGDEWCDKSAFVTEDCAEYSTAFSKGKLTCNDDCTVNTKACTVRSCGDGIVLDNEECDGTAFLDDISSCAEYGPSVYASGSLKCNKDCTIDESGCQRRCGDGNLDDNEFCDGSNFIDNANSCADWLGEGATGTLGCTKTCEIDTSACKAAATAYCGDGKVNTDAEECDGTSFYADVNTCKGYSSAYASGDLSCNSDCTVNTSACVIASTSKCGNGTIDGNEACDKKAFYLDISTCAEYSNAYASGNLSCNSDCTVNTSACKTKAENNCGNGKLDDDEWCDGGNWLMESDECSDYGDYAGGKVTCSATCEIVTAACAKKDGAKCGDGSVNVDGEDCDQNSFYADITDCKDYDSNLYTAGKLGCTNACQYDFSSCTKATTSKCGNGKLDDDEWCDGENFFAGIEQCADYSWNFSGGSLKCNEACEFDTSACVRSVCTEGDTRCYGQSLQMCDENSTWFEMEQCGNDTPVCYADGKDGNCYSGAKASIVPAWCNFQWLDSGIAHTGYGRILLPSGVTSDDVLAYMACTDDLSQPVRKSSTEFNWTVIDATLNANCSDCGDNVEFMTTSSYTGKAGTNYCTFVFDFADDVSIFACRPVQNGASEPIQLYEGRTKLIADLTRQFTNGDCGASDLAKCVGSELYMCSDGLWQSLEKCSGATPVCNASTADCEAAPISYDNTLTFDDQNWTANTTYATTNTASYSDGSKVTVVAAIYKTDHVIDGTTVVMNAKSESSITISNLPAGIGMLSFDYASWGKSDSATLIISDGTTSKTQNVAASASKATYSYGFYNADAKQVTITMTKKSSNGRILIDNLHWTSAN